jgi:hypothetical protein
MNQKKNRQWFPMTLRLQGPLMHDLEAVCSRLNLERSEVARRCIFEGLKTFADVKLPGSGESDEARPR